MQWGMTMRIEDTPTAHLQMMWDDIRTKMVAIMEHGTKLEKGFEYFQWTRQKIDIEIELSKRKDK